MTNTPAPGWYADPQNPSSLRYWDGNAWTEHTHAGTGAADPAAAAAPAAVAAPAPAPAMEQGYPTEATGSYGTPGVQSYDYASTEAPAKSKTGMWIAIGVGALVLFIVLIIAAIAAIAGGGDDDDNADDNPVVESTLGTGSEDETPGEEPAEEEPAEEEPASGDYDASAAVIPGGWTTVDSQSGTYNFAVDPAWEDYSELIDPALLESSFAGVPGASWDFGGMWMAIDEETFETTTIMVMSASDGSDPTQLLGVQVAAFAQAASAGSDSSDATDPESFTSVVGYEGSKVDYTTTVADIASYNAVSAVANDETMAFVYVISTTSQDEANEIREGIENSLVFVGTP